MRDQYAGDISDLIKYSLLRALAGSDRSLGVAWYFNLAHDGGTDGQHIEHMAEDKWARLDSDVSTALAGLSERSVAALEHLTIWPAGTRFHREPVAIHPHRTEWARHCASQLEHCNLVFLDPDNGLGKGSRRHATVDEIKLLRRPLDRALVIIKFPGRVPFADQERTYHAFLRSETGSQAVTTLRTSVVVRKRPGLSVTSFRWFTLVDHDPTLLARLRSFASLLNSIPGARAHLSDPSVN